MNNSVNAVIFDLGRVLIDVDFSRLFNDYIPAERRKQFLFNLDEIIKLPWFVEFSAGKSSVDEFFVKVKEFFQIEISQTEFRSEWSKVFKPMVGMDKLVEKVAEQMPVSLLSDTDIIHWQFLTDSYPWLRIFKNPVLSFEIGQLKPAEICYRKAAESVGQPLANCLFIDDRLINVHGAQQAGMHAIQFESSDLLSKKLQETYNIKL
ncbi:MAG: HAD-IA family hydrolase [Calditrichae bacterium]|nr:HAD-IA family hydrolase [Calditrichota bacterium]MCB9058354.1 HAD-IA family hydrolase [Calditrichia bacterium]